MLGPSYFNGVPFYSLSSPSALYNNIDRNAENAIKIAVVFSNPATLKVFALQCDLFSLGNIEVYQGDELLEDDPVLKLLDNPNPYQTQRQLLWDFMFWLMLGNANVYIDSRLADKENNKIYVLNNQKIHYPFKLRDKSDKLILSKSSELEFRDHKINYCYDDGTNIKIPFDKISTFTDLSTVTNYVSGPSRLDALYKVISNSEYALDSKNINVRYAGKFLVAGKNDFDDVTKPPMDEDEKRDIETKIDDGKPVRAVKSMVDIKRYVENIGRLKLDESYLADYYTIGHMYNIPRDVLEAYSSSTYENQERARLNHVSYTLQPKGDDLVNGLEKYFGYRAMGKDIRISWDHLPFMEVARKERADTDKIKAETLKILVADLGVPIEDAKAYLKIK